MSNRAKQRRQARQAIDDPKIYIATLFPPDRVTGRFATAMHAAIDYGWEQNRRMFYQSYMSSPILSLARNQAVEDFLETEMDWLVMIDSDMIFTADAVHRLIDSALEQGVSIMGAKCFSMVKGGEAATIYKMTGNYEDGMPILQQVGHGQELPVGACHVDATGTGFLAIHRKAFTDISAKYPDEEYPWFRPIKGKLSPEFGEDLSFCVRARTCELEIMVDTRVGVGHVKPVIIGDVH
jgi:hypothetical protein